MVVFVLPSKSAFEVHLPRFPLVSSATTRGQFHLILGGSSNRKRKHLLTGNWQCRPRIIVASNIDGSSDSFADVADDEDDYLSGRYEILKMREDELMDIRRALSEAQAKQEAIEKERDQLLEEFSHSEAKQQGYVAAILHDKEVAISEL
ncbi:hypothetical protein QUC31_017616 [Theobroma cacao]